MAIRKRVRVVGLGQLVFSASGVFVDRIELTIARSKACGYAGGAGGVAESDADAARAKLVAEIAAVVSKHAPGHTSEAGSVEIYACDGVRSSWIVKIWRP